MGRERVETPWGYIQVAGDAYATVKPPDALVHLYSDHKGIFRRLMGEREKEHLRLNYAAPVSAAQEED